MNQEQNAFCDSDNNSSDEKDFQLVEDEDDGSNNLDYSFINVENENTSDASCSTTGEEEEEEGQFNPCDRIEEVQV
jgi:hypothetical protein